MQQQKHSPAIGNQMMVTNRVAPEKEMFICKECLLIFHTTVALDQHQRMAHVKVKLAIDLFHLDFTVFPNAIWGGHSHMSPMFHRFPRSLPLFRAYEGWQKTDLLVNHITIGTRSESGSLPLLFRRYHRCGVRAAQGEPSNRFHLFHLPSSIQKCLY